MASDYQVLKIPTTSTLLIYNLLIRIRLGGMFKFEAWGLVCVACEQALLGVGGGGRRGKEERACNDVSGI